MTEPDTDTAVSTPQPVSVASTEPSQASVVLDTSTGFVAELPTPHQVAPKATKINKMVFEGFKSFGRRTELILSDGFTTVVGPNGSGKSNVLDGLCFVLGKSSSKAMRAEKSSNLIYNGGKTRQPSRQAEVSIVFDNVSKLFPTPDDEVKITRIVRQDGQSIYRINGKTRTRQEVLELLARAKIDPDGYNIILQGDVVHFCQMAPVERRQIVEEIAGISIYEDKKNQSMNELGKVDEKLNQAEIILKERETYLKELKRDRDQALKYKTLNDQIKQNKATYVKKQIDKKSEEYETVAKKVASFKEKFEKAQAKIKDLRAAITAKRDEIQAISKEVEEKGETDQILLQKEVERLRVSVETKKTRASFCQAELRKVVQRKEQLTQNIADITVRIDAVTTEKESLEEQLRQSRKQLYDLDASIKVFKEKHHISTDTENLEQSIEKLDKDAEAFQQQVQASREKQQSLLREKDRIDFQLQTIDQQIEKVEELEASNASEVRALKQRKEEFKKSVLELNQCLNKDSSLAATVAQSRSRLLELQEQLARFEVQQAAVQERAAGSIAIKKVMENASTIGEVYGTVAELGSVPSKYAAALEVAASNRIQSIIVEDDKTAAKAIKFLKSNKYGTATFLPLNKIKPATMTTEMKAMESEAGVHGFALDLITFDPKFKNAFSHVFGSTLVVDNIDVARRLGIGKARMVSLDGDLAETSGAMIGGYRQKTQGAFKDSKVAESLAKAQEESSRLQQQLKAVETEKTELEERITRLREHKAALEGDIIKAEKSLHLDTSDMDASKSLKEELLTRNGHIAKETDDVLSLISEQNKQLADIKIRKQQLRDQVADLRKPTVIAQLNAYEQKRRELQESMMRLEGEQKNLDVQLRDILERDRENTSRVLKEMDKEAEGFVVEQKELEKTVKEEGSLLKTKEKEQAAFHSQFKALFEKRNKLSDDVGALENNAFVAEDDSRKVEFTMNTHSIDEAKVKAELAGLQVEFSQYEGIALVPEKTEEQLRKEIADFEKMRETIGSVNMRALEIYETVEKEYVGLVEKKNTLMTEKNDVVGLIEEIEKSKKSLFMATLRSVTEHFKRIFNALTTKGEVELDIENPEQPFDGGLGIKVKLVGNKFLDLRSLSGGEQTLTALAFIFAIQEHSPATFYVLDEVDAALDKSNSEKLAKLIRKYCEKAQYLVISHNDNVITEADILYGISMGDHGMSNVVGLKI